MKFGLLTRFGMAIALVLTSASFSLTSAQVNFNQVAKRLRFVPPSTSLRLEGHVREVGVRCPACPPTKLQMTALSFFQKEKGNYAFKTYVWGFTTKEYPTFWFYIPEYGESATSAYFRLEDVQSNTVIYETSLTPPKQAGIVDIKLPSTVKPLDAGKQYYWYFSVDCANVLAAVHVRGTIQRVSLDPQLATQLNTATPHQQVELYAQNGIWFDALTALGELRQQYPQDSILARDWGDLLESVGLEDVANAPLSQTLKPTQEPSFYSLQCNH